MKHYLSIFTALLLTSLAASCNAKPGSPSQQVLERADFTPYPIEAPCISADSLSCALQFPGGHEPMSRLYDKIDHVMQSRQGNINIFHIGGSHVQAGDLSHTIRTRLTEMAPGLTGDHGLLFPFRAVKTNGPRNYGLQYSGRWFAARNLILGAPVTMGLAGIAAVTADSASHLYLDLREERKWDFVQLHILGEASDHTVYPIVITQTGDTILSTQTQMGGGYSIFDLKADGLNLPGYRFLLPAYTSECTIAFKGLGHVAAEPQARRRGSKPAPNYAPLDSAHYFILRGIVPHSCRPGITYTESGINGASLPFWLRCDKSLFQQELGAMPPDLVIFGIGINDANIPQSEFDPETFKSQYRELIQRIQEVNPATTFIFITNNDCWYGSSRQRRRTLNRNTPIVVQAFMELAEEYHAAVFDVFNIMGGLGGCEEWVKNGLMQRDRIHFTHEGYNLIGNMLYNALLEDYLHERALPQ